MRRAALLLLAVLTTSLAGLTRPAAACGCGAMIAKDRIEVDGESSIVRWDGTTEQIIMRLAVATLDATDARALSGWLGDHGYQLRPELGQALDGYVKRRWKYVAVRLAPQAGTSLRGQLDPLQLSFASPDLVYPMAISHLATTPQHVHLWVLAPHRVQRVDADARRFAPRAEFAGPAAGVRGDLGAFIGADQWVTEFDATYSSEQISSDWRFAYTADKAFRQVDVRHEPLLILGIPAGWFLVSLGIAALLTGVIGIAIAVGRRSPVSR